MISESRSFIWQPKVLMRNCLLIASSQKGLLTYTIHRRPARRGCPRQPFRTGRMPALAIARQPPRANEAKKETP